MARARQHIWPRRRQDRERENVVLVVYIYVSCSVLYKRKDHFGTWQIDPLEHMSVLLEASTTW